MEHEILVTDSTGSIGKYALRHLALKGIPVVAGSRHPQNVASFPQVSVLPKYIDYMNPASIENALEGIRKIFIVLPINPDMPQMTRNLLNAMSGVTRIVSITASGADLNSPYAPLRWHGEVKDMIIRSDIPYTFISPSHFYQNYLPFCRETIKAENRFYFAQGSAKKSMIDGFDVGEIASNILMEQGHEGRTYALAGRDYTNIEIAEIFSRVLGRNIEYVDAAPEEYRIILRGLCVPEWKVEALSMLNAAYKAGGRLKSNEETVKLLGRNPRSFDDFVTENATEF